MGGTMQLWIQGFTFSDRGEFVAKGFEEPVRVYEVRWRE
jgi:class 3 adenylate cyclase